MKANSLLERLTRVKVTRPGHFLAACPCCQSRRGRPISVRELEDGRLLVYCFCGCDTEVVLSALGLTLADLFERPIGRHLEPSSSRIPARDILAAIEVEILMVSIIASDFLAQRSIDEIQWARLAQSASRIQAAADHAH